MGATVLFDLDEVLLDGECWQHAPALFLAAGGSEEEFHPHAPPFAAEAEGEALRRILLESGSTPGECEQSLPLCSELVTCGPQSVAAASGALEVLARLSEKGVRFSSYSVVGISTARERCLVAGLEAALPVASGVAARSRAEVITNAVSAVGGSAVLVTRRFSDLVAATRLGASAVVVSADGDPGLLRSAGAEAVLPSLVPASRAGAVLCAVSILADGERLPSGPPPAPRVER